MATLKINGDTSGYVELVSPAVAGSTSIELDKILVSDSSGNVGIGETSPDYRLEVKGTATTNTDIVGFSNSNGTVKHIFGLENVGAGRYSIRDASNNTAVFFSAHDADNSYVNAGNFGIGTSSPSSLLDVDKSQNSETNIELTNTNAGSDAQVRTKYTTDGGLFTVGKTSNAHAYGGDAYIHNVDNTNIRFATSDAERMRIRSDGNIHINTTTPDLVGNTTSLTIGGSSFGGDGMLSLQSGWGGTTYGRVFASGGKLKIGNPQSNDIELYTANLTRMKIDASGRVTMPYQPAACFSGQTTTSSTQRIGPGTAELNNGGHLAVGGSFNGRFTCPVAGMYFVSMMTSTAYNGHYNWIEIRKNNTLVRDRVHWNKGGTSMHVNPSVQVITQCSAGDYLEAWQNNANSVAQDILDYAVINIHLIG